MASKLRNKYQRRTTPAYGLDKQNPLDLETLNSEPKGKSKSKNTRLLERQEREKLLQQHRSHQQESLKQQRERDNVHKIHPSAEHNRTNQDTQYEEPVEASSITITVPDVLQEDQQPGYRSETDAHHVTGPDVRDHKSPDHYVTCQENEQRNMMMNYLDETHGALGDSIPGKVRSNRQRCTNCCGRDQYRLTNANGKCPSEKEDQKQDHDGCRCCAGKTDQIQIRKSTSSNSWEAEAVSHLDQSTSQTSSFLEEPHFKDENETRLRGGCGGGCGGSGGARNSACCPCGGCGGAACSTNTSWDSKPPFGCCGGNQSRGLPCRCKCKSCSNPSPPCGTCGGQNCGKWNSCAGSGGGKCCFPRNTRRHNGPGCCGGGNGGCGSSGGCC